MTCAAPQPDREALPCNLCGSADHALWAQVGPARIVRCRACGLVFTNPRLPQAALTAAYEEDYGAAHEDPVLLAQRRRMYQLERVDILKMVDGERRSHRRLLRSLMPSPSLRSGEGNVNGASGRRFLDVGCGTGEFLALMRDRFEVYGVEVSRAYLRMARERYALPHLSAGELTDADFESDFFDVVQMRGVLQHLPDPLGQLREAFRVTKPGGLLVISATPNIASPAARVFGANFRLLAPDQMLTNFSPRTLRAMLEQAGYQVERFSFPYVTTPYFRWTQPAEFAWLALKVRLRRLLKQDVTGLRSPAFFGSMMTCLARKPSG